LNVEWDGERIQGHGSENMTLRLGTEYAASWVISNLCLSPPSAELPPCEMTKKTLHCDLQREGQSFDRILDIRLVWREFASLIGIELCKCFGLERI
jgi:hypothetical protein